jgi:hypothetical protein
MMNGLLLDDFIEELRRHERTLQLQSIVASPEQ